MGDIVEYMSTRRVLAEKLDEGEYVNATSGRIWGNAGDYVTYTADGAYVVPGDEFEREYKPIPEDVSEARKFIPAGKTVEQVVEFLKENPDEIERVKQLERDGGSRKGILEYEI